MRQSTTKAWRPQILSLSYPSPEDADTLGRSWVADKSGTTPHSPVRRAEATSPDGLPGTLLSKSL